MTRSAMRGKRSSGVPHTPECKARLEEAMAGDQRHSERLMQVEARLAGAAIPPVARQQLSRERIKARTTLATRDMDQREWGCMTETTRRALGKNCSRAAVTQQVKATLHQCSRMNQLQQYP